MKNTNQSQQYKTNSSLTEGETFVLANKDKTADTYSPKGEVERWDTRAADFLEQSRSPLFLPTSPFMI